MTNEDRTIARALKILERRIKGEALLSPTSVKQFLTLKLARLEHEAFSVIFLDSQHYVIGYAEMFRGSLSQTAVYPREVVKTALHMNAAGVIFSHNHPSAVCEPSVADRMLTDALKRALELVDVKVLDHFIVAGPNTYSFAEHGLL